ncbi:MAG TPA: GNAT family N-acetyltransferase [Solirubrobacterales bacterium]|nr:GNAT family N-acetyltransferase [Solirubrobacterales bacterium]
MTAAIRRATPDDAPDVGRLLHDFNTEFDDYTPGSDVLAQRAAEMIASGEVLVLLGGDGPDGLALLTIRRQIFTGEPDAYLQELYVVPERRGHGLGRALLEAAMDLAREEGADHFDLTTSEGDTAALGLYESAGFTNREGSPEGPRMLYFERDL